MKMKTLLAAVAVSSLVLVQPAAAATRSYQSLPTSGAKVSPADRISVESGESEGAALALGPLLVIIATALAVAAAAAASSNHKSP